MINCNFLNLQNYLLYWQTSDLRLAVQFKQDQNVICFPPLTTFLFFFQNKVARGLPEEAWLQHSIQSQGEVQKSSGLLDHLNYNMLKGDMDFLPKDTKNKLPTPALNVKLQTVPTNSANNNTTQWYVCRHKPFTGIGYSTAVVLEVEGSLVFSLNVGLLPGRHPVYFSFTLNY